ncbi:MAG: hypothetical protein ACR2QF_15705 [Geminicoccaceae bacterium]
MPKTWLSRLESSGFVFATMAALTILIIGASFAREKASGLEPRYTGAPLAITKIKPVFLRLAADRSLIKTIDPAEVPLENGQLILDVDVDAFDVIDVDIDTTSPSTYYMHFYYWMKDGINLPITDSYYTLRLANDPDGKGLRFVNQFEALPVNRQADKLHSMIFPKPPSDMAVHQFAFFGRTLTMDATAAVEDTTIKGELGGSGDAAPIIDLGKIDVAFAERQDRIDEDKIAARGLSFRLDNLAAAYQVGLDHRPHELPLGSTIIGKFAPQTLILVDMAGDARTIGTHAADLIEIDRGEGSAVVTIYDYHFRERTQHFKERLINDDGVRMNINAGLTRRLPANALTIFQRKGAEIAFLSRHARGHLATLTIGEHADHVVVENDPLIMFGHDEGEIRIDGKGFIGNDIPITRTVFGTGGDGPTESIRHRQKVWQDKSTPRISEKVPSLESSPELRRLFDLYLEVGANIEYGPHSSAMSRADVPGNTKSRKTMARALRQVERYQPRVSIDHGGLEVIHVFGWNKAESDYYTLDLLHNAGIDYIYTLADKLSGDLSMLFPNQASNVFYALPSIADAELDRTEPSFFAQNQITWDEALFSMDRLETMLEQRGFLNFHTYLGNDITLPKFDDAGQFHGEYSLVPWFNDHLQNIDATRDRGDLWLGLNSELYDFQRGLDGLSFSWADRCIELEGTGPMPIDGVTLAVAHFDDGKWSEDRPIKGSPTGISGMRHEDRIDYLWFPMAPKQERRLCLDGPPLT